MPPHLTSIERLHHTLVYCHITAICNVEMIDIMLWAFIGYNSNANLPWSNMYLQGDMQMHQNFCNQISKLIQFRFFWGCLMQVSLVSRLKHENVVELIGYCLDGSLRVLAYEFATMGSLHDILHGGHFFTVY